MTSVLVAHASKHGSTHETADWVAAVLRDRGFDVDVLPAAIVESVAAYDGVVLGGALYAGRLHADARAFLRRHRGALAHLPCAVFALGPRSLEQDDLAGSRSQLDAALAKTPDVEPFAIAIFGGVVRPAELRFPFNHMPASDARDREAIERWAAMVADVVRYGKPADLFSRATDGGRAERAHR